MRCQGNFITAINVRRTLLADRWRITDAWFQMRLITDCYWWNRNKHKPLAFRLRPTYIQKNDDSTACAVDPGRQTTHLCCPSLMDTRTLNHRRLAMLWGQFMAAYPNCTWQRSCKFNTVTNQRAVHNDWAQCTQRPILSYMQESRVANAEIIQARNVFLFFFHEDIRLK
jgi:hypothetical protein